MRWGWRRGGARPGTDGVARVMRDGRPCRCDCAAAASMAACPLSALYGWLDGDGAGVLWVLVLGVGVELATMAVWVVGAAVLRCGNCREAESCSGRAAGTLWAQNVAALESGCELRMCGLLGYFVCEVHTVLLLPSRVHPSILFFYAMVETSRWKRIQLFCSVPDNATSSCQSCPSNVSRTHERIYFICLSPAAGDMVGPHSHGQSEESVSVTEVVQQGLSTTETARGGARGGRHWLKLGGRRGACRKTLVEAGWTTGRLQWGHGAGDGMRTRKSCRTGCTRGRATEKDSAEDWCTVVWRAERGHDAGATKRRVAGWPGMCSAR